MAPIWALQSVNFSFKIKHVPIRVDATSKKIAPWARAILLEKVRISTWLLNPTLLRIKTQKWIVFIWVLNTAFMIQESFQIKKSIKKMFRNNLLPISKKSVPTSTLHLTFTSKDKKTHILLFYHQKTYKWRGVRDLKITLKLLKISLTKRWKKWIKNIMKNQEGIRKSCLVHISLLSLNARFYNRKKNSQEKKA